MFEVQRTMCQTCIYRTSSPLDLARLEAEIADLHMEGFFTTFRECHHAPPGSGICCAGFYAKHREHFTLGQIAQRLDWVEYVEVDVLPGSACPGPLVEPELAPGSTRGAGSDPGTRACLPPAHTRETGAVRYADVQVGEV